MSPALPSQVVTSDVLREARILILHMVRADRQPSLGPLHHTLSLPVTPPCPPQGRDFSFDDCGRAFTCLPVEEPGAVAEALVCNLDSLLGTMTHRVCVWPVGWGPGLGLCDAGHPVAWGWVWVTLKPSGCP